MDRGSTGLEVTRRHLLHLVGGLALLVGFGPPLPNSQHEAINGRENDNEDRTQWFAPVDKGPAGYFSGSVRVEPVFQVGDPMRLNAGVSLSSPAPHRMAYASAWPNPRHHGRSRLGANRRWTDRGSPAG